jgi:hypothetical protein
MEQQIEECLKLVQTVNTNLCIMLNVVQQQNKKTDKTHNASDVISSSIKDYITHVDPNIVPQYRVEYNSLADY